MPVTTISLAEATKPAAEKQVFFWKPNDGNGYLSQWYWSKCTVEGEAYVTAEMWMMVQKARCFGDEVRRLLLTQGDRVML
jgi:predicted NAD-dependent protein-ADP-ribosyltransferase YbiA (DUF1768 family)